MQLLRGQETRDVVLCGDVVDRALLLDGVSALMASTRLGRVPAPQGPGGTIRTAGSPRPPPGKERARAGRAGGRGRAGAYLAALLEAAPAAAAAAAAAGCVRAVWRHVHTWRHMHTPVMHRAVRLRGACV